MFLDVDPFAPGPSVVVSPDISPPLPTAGLLGLPVNLKDKEKGRAVPVLADVAPVSPEVATINVVSDVGITNTEGTKKTLKRVSDYVLCARKRKKGSRSNLRLWLEKKK